MSRKYNIIVCLLFVMAFHAAGNDTLDKKNEFRIKRLEEYRLFDDKKFDSQRDYVEKSFQNKSKELDLKLDEYRQDKNRLEWIIYIFGGLSVVGAWTLIEKIKLSVGQKINEKFDSIIDDKQSHLINLIENHDKENKLKKSKSILIVATEDAEVAFLLSFFNKLGFKHPKLIRSNTYKELSEVDMYDLLFVFREDGNYPLSDEVSLEYIINKRDDAVGFTFGTGYLTDPRIDKKTFASATNWSQLYGNLVSALKYQKIID